MPADINDFFSLIHSTDNVDWLRVVRNEVDKRLANLGVSPSQAAAHAASPLLGVSNVPDVPASPPVQVNVGPNQNPFKRDGNRAAQNASAFAAAAQLEQGKRQEAAQAAAAAGGPTLPADSQQHVPAVAGEAKAEETEAAAAAAKKDDKKHGHK